MERISKHLRAGIAILLILALLAGCSAANSSNTASASTPSDTESITIAASFYPMYIMLLNVVKDIPGIEVVDMTQPTTGCLHDYTMTTQDMKNLDNAQALVINGADMESFMDKVIAQFPDLKIIDAGKNIPLIKGDGDEGDNPHIWVSVSGAISQVKNIGGQLAAIDAINAAAYAKNTDAYVKKLEALSEKMHKALDGLKNKDIITFHEAFPYFAREFSLNIAGVIEREPGSEPSAQDITDTIDLIKGKKVAALFAEPQYPAAAADTIAQETGMKVYTLDPAVTGPMDADAYLKIMDSNLKVLEEALQ
jgi:zinc transport system substrate-binding protein